MLRIITIILASLAAAFLLLMAIGLILSQRGAPVLVLLPLLVIVVLLMIFFAISAADARTRRAWIVLGSLDQAFRMNLPLPRVVASMAESEPGRLGKDLRRVHDALQTGAPFAIALGVLPSVPERILRLVISAERIGRLPQVMARLLEQRQAAIASRAGRLPFYRFYPMVLCTIYVSVSSLLFVFVIPKFEAIFKDFNIHLPYATTLLLQVAHHWGGPLMTLATVMFVSFVSLAFGSWWPGGSSAIITGITSRVFDYLPLVGDLRMKGALADLLHYSADAMESGYPLEVSLREAAEIAPSSRLRSKLRRWLERISAGESPGNAARDAGLPALMSGMINSSSHGGDLPEVFRFLARYYGYRYAATAALIEASILPLLALSMGVLVGWLMVAMLLPMVALINQCVPYPVRL